MELLAIVAVHHYRASGSGRFLARSSVILAVFMGNRIKETANRNGNVMCFIIIFF